MNIKGYTVRLFIRLIQVVLLFFVVHSSGFAATKQNENLIRYALIPLEYIITYVAYILGFYFLAWGLFRLRHSQEGGSYNRQASGTGSALCFLAAVFLFQYQPVIKVLGQSLLGMDSGAVQKQGWKVDSGTLPVDPVNIFGYLSGVGKDGKGEPKGGIIIDNRGDTNRSTLETLFAILMIVGFVSFIRGSILLVKAGEGAAGGESAGTKAVIHIIAAAILCNANHFTAIGYIMCSAL